jgi:ribosomal protein L33
MAHTRSKKRQPEYEQVEYSDLPFLVPHKIERDKRLMLISLVCTTCGDEYNETYSRQYPDRLASGLYCPACQTRTYRLVAVIPNTVYYRSHAMEHASFSDDIKDECFECGKTQELRPFAFSNGMQVQLCTAHQHRYLKQSYKLATATK